MRTASFLAYLWKLLLCGLTFLLGVSLGGVAAKLVGLPDPAAPAGVDPVTISLYLIPVSMILALTLSFVSRGLSAGFVTRWLILASLVWMVYALNTYLEASIFSTFAAASPFMLVVFLVASIICGAVVALLFSPQTSGTSLAASLRAFVAHHDAWGWA